MMKTNIPEIGKTYAFSMTAKQVSPVVTKKERIVRTH